MRSKNFFGLLLAATLPAASALADEASDKAREDMQRSLNQEVMASKFNPGDAHKAKAYAEEAKRNNVTPVAQPPSYWVPGWSCYNLTTYRYYNYGDYQSCIYYHHYYGRYW
jgi:hypothetical protein